MTFQDTDLLPLLFSSLILLLVLDVYPCESVLIVGMIQGFCFWRIKMLIKKKVVTERMGIFVTLNNKETLICTCSERFVIA